MSQAPLMVIRLLANPMGDEAPPGSRGDIVRVSDGRAKVFLTPAEYDVASEERLRYLLAQELR